MGRWTQPLSMLLVCALGLACAPKRVPLRCLTVGPAPTSQKMFYGLPLQPHSSEALLRVLKEKEQAGEIGSFSLSGHRLLIRQMKDCCAELDVLYDASFSHAEAVIGVSEGSYDLWPFSMAQLLDERRARFVGTLGNGFLYKTGLDDTNRSWSNHDRFVVLNLSPTDSGNPRVLKSGWFSRSPHDLADELGLVSPRNELQKLRALIAAGKVSDARALLDRDAWLFELTAEAVTSEFRQLSEHLHPKAPPDETEALVLALQRGDVFERLKSLQQARTHLKPASIARANESVQQLVEEMTGKAELADMQGRLATAAFLYRERATIDPKATVARANELEATLRAKCEPKLRFSGALAGEPSFEAPGTIEVIGATPLVKLSPKFAREERTSTYNGPVKLTERFSGEDQRRLVEIAARLKEIEYERTKAPASASPLDKEVSDLNAERTKLFDAAATKREMGDLPNHYVATTQTWIGSLVMTAVTSDGEKVEVTVQYKSVPRVRVTADPEHNVAGMNEWIDDATARKDAIAFGRRALLDKIREQLIVGRTRACLVEGARNVEGSDDDRRREKELREKMDLQRSTMQ